MRAAYRNISMVLLSSLMSRTRTFQCTFKMTKADFMRCNIVVCVIFESEPCCVFSHWTRFVSVKQKYGHCQSRDSPRNRCDDLSCSLQLLPTLPVLLLEG